MAIDRKDLFTLTHYEYGEAYFGSYRGMRYRVARDPFKDVHFAPEEERYDAQLSATVWPGPYSYADTAEDKKETKLFPYSEEGMGELVAWLNEVFEERRKDWAA